MLVYKISTIFDQIKDEIAIQPPFYSHSLLICDPSKFCRDLRANPPPIGPLSPPWSPPMPKSLLVTLSGNIKRGQTGSNEVKRGQTGSNEVKLGQTRHVGYRGISSIGARHPPGHVVHWGMLSTEACCSRGILSWGILSQGILSRGLSSRGMSFLGMSSQGIMTESRLK